MVDKYIRRHRADNYAHAPVHWRCEPEIEERCPPQPELVRANPADWPPLFLPAWWEPERRAVFVERWKAA